MARESAEGQAIELGWRRDNGTDVDEADYLEMVLKKTCWLATIYPSRVGALIGTGGAHATWSRSSASASSSARRSRSRTTCSTWSATSATARSATATSGRASGP